MVGTVATQIQLDIPWVVVGGLVILGMAFVFFDGKKWVRRLLRRPRSTD
jgi:hypothetical protein